MRGMQLTPLYCALLACAGAESAPRARVTRSAPRTEPSALAVPAAEPEPIIEEAPPPDPIATLLAMTGSESTSIGAPADGRIEGSIALPESGPGFRSNVRRPNQDAIYGTVEMLQALVHAAGVVETALPGSTLMINDLGLREGGPITHHGSHRAGRDVDVLFYLIDRHGDPLDPVGAFLDERGRGYDFKDLADPRDDVLVRMDLPRTWAFVRALLEGPRKDEVQRIFVAEHLRTLLLQYAERTRAPRAIRARFGELTCQPSYPHDDHFHIRFFCTPEDMAAGCEDATPIYAWRRSALRELGLSPVVYRRRPDRPESPTVSHDEARRNAGRMHSRVREWLARREAWMNPPSAGRAFCR
jgi:penicillin-insensitive murein DD-endopeptidase